MKDDEKNLLVQFQARTRVDHRPWARELVKELGMHEKRGAYILGKWSRKGWYEFGVSVMAGWLTDEGMRVWVGCK